MGTITVLLPEMAHSSVAQQKITKEYYHLLLRQVLRNTNVNISYEDAEEVVNDVLYATFTKDNWETLTSRSHLLAYMSNVVTKKAISRYRANTAQKRNLGNSLAEFDEAIHAIKLVTADPYSDWCGEQVDKIFCLIRSKPGNALRDEEILRNLLDGGNPRDCAEKVGCTTRTVQRFLESLRKRLADLSDDSND